LEEQELSKTKFYKPESVDRTEFKAGRKRKKALRAHDTDRLKDATEELRVALGVPNHKEQGEQYES
jgi:hypothetical protein